MMKDMKAPTYMQRIQRDWPRSEGVGMCMSNGIYTENIRINRTERGYVHRTRLDVRYHRLREYVRLAC